MKHCLIVAVIITILMPIPGTHAQNSGVIQGVVRDRSANQVLPNHEITLETHAQEEGNQQTKAMTDAEGRHYK